MSASDLRFPILTLTAAFAAGSLAQNSSPVTDADIERVRRETPTVTEQDIEAARRKYGALGEANMRHTPALTGPNVEALPQPLKHSPVDLEALARGYGMPSEAMSQARRPARGPGLWVFISLSMPRPTLQRLVDQAARARAAIVLRGFAHGSLRHTVAQVQSLIGNRQVAVQIDPQAFDHFAVTRVPTFVLVRDGTRPADCASGSCAPPESFLLTSGDVSLDYALEYMRHSAPNFGPAADIFLKRIKG